MRPVKITDTTLRDAHQSLWATRMRTEDMLPILTELDEAGFFSLEVWGGATFDVCLRFLGEDPWVRLRQIKSRVKKTPLQMLLRAQSLVGYQHYPDDVVREFVKLSVKNGIDIIRIFDALNDVRNMVVPMEAAKKAGAHVQASVVYTISPVHTTKHYLETATALAELGADSICIKDMAGLLTPLKAYELVSLLKKELGIMVHLHSHYIGGMAVGTYLKAAEAGVDVVDTASVPLAFGASQPPVETVVRAFQETDFDSGISLRKLFHIAKYFESLRKSRGFERGITRISDMRVFEHQVPGGMISNLVSQLEEQGALDRIHDVLEEIPKVRAELGYPPLVTPTSQIVGTQAVLNVLSGARYKLVPGEVKGYVRGLYGRPPASIDLEIQKKIIGDDEPMSVRPADLLDPGMAKAKQDSLNLAQSEEDVVSYALFPQIAKKFFEEREKGIITREETQDRKAKKDIKETLTGLLSKEDSKLNLQEIKELIQIIDETEISELNLESDGVKIAIRKGTGVPAGIPVVSVPRQDAVPAVSAAAPVPPSVEVPVKTQEPVFNENTETITSPMVGTFYAAQSPEADPYVKVGQVIEVGQPVCIVEAMKLMNEIESEVAGKVLQILVENGQPVEYGQPLFVIEK
ncbi:acetyl-CoA carboxylase, biotin carboxyl carrier protein [Desulfosporosinus orientis DSM 765]|uniref:Acetyl-CoA carboxylase, biotin carboxyl carrier protein n=1 Tax=Desulfosporosinus orientis (strain ATCC 19365 / DSM 765 / NCIMB 8382 / VKM B-1628 / Singapore I) TaxID=768706 RepID=G7W860_DESOD|nr:acetyl-CoA carboxylase biotin carboxyl carrier protein [Desulfosporosinus orientis]AET66706.1 acetyl-CoA carboxylase, biotin carboxyl carrier protein [Desulfosporosinus orientis DSM 765]